MEFLLPDGYGLGQLLADLDEQYLYLVETPVDSQAAIFDSFDWRLYAKGYSLWQNEYTLQLFSLYNGAKLYQQVLPTIPKYVEKLPEGALKSELAPILDVRALLSLVHLNIRENVVRILNDDEKTVARLILQIYSIADCDRDISIQFLQIHPVRGYPRYLRELSTRYRTAGFKTISFQELYFEILNIVGKKPGDYSAKINVQLEPELPTIEAMKRILQSVAEVMIWNLPGILEDVDPEFNHDFRVSVRRTRSALSQVKGVFPNDEISGYTTFFKELGNLTSPLRDFDVYLLKEKTYKSILPPSLRPGIDPMFDYIREHRGEALKAVCDGLQSEAFITTMRSWDTYLSSPTPSNIGTVNSHRPILQVASERIYKRFRKILKDGLVILDNLEDEKLHALRIECKKLRYLLEFFSSLFPEDEIEKMVRQLKRLQDNLGDFNDLCVQEWYLLDLADKLDRLDNKTMLAIGCLVGLLQTEKDRQRAAFAKAFQGFSGRKSIRRYRKLFLRNYQKDRV